MFWTFIFWTLVSIGLSYAIQYLTRQEMEEPRIEPDTFDMPDVREGGVYPIVFGTCWVNNSIVNWWGDLATQPIYEKYYERNWYGKKKKKYVQVGNKYGVGIHFRICQGVCDGIKQIKVGEAVAWPDPTDKTVLQADGATSTTINEPNLFGGDDKDGGITGTVAFQYGGAAQTPDSYLVTHLGSDISASRGFTGAVLRRVYQGNSPYLKKWGFLIKRVDTLTDGSTQWYPSKAEPITGTLNPVHMIRECMTNTNWGLGYHTSLFDSTIWEGVADTLYTEGFGLSMKWDSDNQSIEKFIGEILRHIYGVLYQDAETGDFVLKLLRDDYSVGGLETFNEHDASISDYVITVPHEVPSTIWLKYWNMLDNIAVSISDDDIALMDVQGGKTVAMEKEYLGVTSDALASKLAARERLIVSVFPYSATLKAKRTMAHLRPGDVINFAYAPYSITQIILRVIDVGFGTLDDEHVILKCISDVFALEDGLYATTPTRQWTDPRNDPADVSTYLLMEAPFWESQIELGITEALALDADADFLLCAAAQPTNDSYAYDLKMRISPTDSFMDEGTGYFTAYARLTNDMPRNAADVVTDLYDLHVILADIQVGVYVMIGDEILKVKSVDASNDRITFARGCLDTVPDLHYGQPATAGGDYVWFLGSYSFVSGYEFTNGDTPGVKFLTKTGLGILAEGSATIYTATAFGSRQTRPYPPGNFKINSVSYPSSFSGQPTISWTHRDRTQQTSEIVEHSAASIGPETSVTYTLKIYDENNSLIRTESGLTGTSYTYSQSDEISDSGLGTGDPLNTSLRFVLYSVRGAYDSWQQYDLRVNRV
jgi:hypothetical protein